MGNLMEDGQCSLNVFEGDSSMKDKIILVEFRKMRSEIYFPEAKILFR